MKLRTLLDPDSLEVINAPSRPLGSTSAFLRDRPLHGREPPDTPSSLWIVQDISAAAHHLVKVAMGAGMPGGFDPLAYD
jgi:hypothetical protein